MKKLFKEEFWILFSMFFGIATIIIFLYAYPKPKPVITIRVSNRGILIGSSTVTNDGDPFGPDTPHTKTSGIQEAINTLATNGRGGIVLLRQGVYLVGTNLNAPKITQ